MQGCVARAIALCLALAFVIGVLIWLITTATSALGSHDPSELEYQAALLAFQRQELEIEQQRADWERSQAQAAAVQPTINLAFTILVLLGVAGVAGLMLAAGDQYLIYRRRKIAQYVVINDQLHLLTPRTKTLHLATPVSPRRASATSIVRAASWQASEEANLDSVWTDNPADYHEGTTPPSHIRYSR